MLTRRNLLAAGAAVPVTAATGGKMFLCMHQTTSVAAGFRGSLEGYARAGIRHVELIPPLIEEFTRSESVAAARRLLSDLGLRAVSSGGVRGLVEPHAGRAQALEDLKRIAALAAEMGIDRMVCPCGTAEKFRSDDYARGVDNLRQAGDIVKPLGITAMLEFMRGSTFIGGAGGSRRGVGLGVSKAPGGSRMVCAAISAMTPAVAEPSKCEAWPAVI